MRMIWLSCEGETAADEEHMGKVHYVPWQVDYFKMDENLVSKWRNLHFQNGEQYFLKWQKMIFLNGEQYNFKSW